MKTSPWINRSAIAIALLAAALGLGMSILARTDSGIRLKVEGDRLVVAEVLPYSSAGWSGLVGAAWSTRDDQAPVVIPGTVVVTLNDETIVSLPEYTYASPTPTANPVTGDYPDQPPTGIAPAVPTLAVPVTALPGLAAEPVRSLSVVSPEELAAWTPEGAAVVGWEVPWALLSSLMTWVTGLLVLLLGAWWLLAGRAGETLRAIAWPLTAAVAVPLLAWPLGASMTFVGIAMYSLLVPSGLLPMATVLVRAVDDRTLWVPAALAAGMCAVGAAALWVFVPASGFWAGSNQVLMFSLLAGAITLVPALAASGSARGRLADTDPGDRRILAGSGLVVAGATPFFAIQSAVGPFPLALPLWLGAVAIANRVTVRPLARAASRANIQRDLVVAATEAERARVAADIHDDALQELTLLVRRLDSAGDTESADIARGVSERLRAICGDLRLPILDDLGVGPALDWLVLRMERIADGPVRLERAEGPRPPADVELALFRVAQEALANAVKHGATPITVRYRSSEGSASLSVDDSGAGIDAGAAERATGQGHYGLLNMTQRAEAIGAILDVRRWPGGGTHVQVEWRAR